MQAVQLDETSTTDQGTDKTSGTPAQTDFAALVKMRISTYADWGDPLTLSNDNSGNHRYHGFEFDAAGNLYHHRNANTSVPNYGAVNLWTDGYTGSAWLALTTDGTTQNAYFKRPAGAFTVATSLSITLAITPARLSVGRQPIFGTTDVNGLVEFECILIYNKALPPSECRRIMEANSRRPVRWQNLIFWNDCSDPKKLNIDMSGKGGNWALTGTPGQVRSPGASRFRLHSSGLWLLRTQAAGTAYTGDVNETVSLSEAAAAQMATSAGPAETVSLSEALAASQGTTPSGLDENVPLNETADGIRGHVVTPSETVSGPTESLVAQYKANVGVSETDNLSESLAAQVATSAAPAETLNLSEALAASAGSPIALNETVSLSEALAAVYGAIAALAETVSVSEAVDGQIGNGGVDVGETVGLSESVAAQMATSAGPAETVSLSEALDAARGTSAGVAETVSLSESLAAFQSMLAALAESVSLAEGLAAVYGAVVGLAETDSLSEAIDVQGGGGGVDLNETVTLSEQVAAQMATSAAVSETVALSEAVAAARGTLAGLAESLGVLGEALAASYGANASLAETVSTGEAVDVAGGSTSVALSETVGLSEALAASMATAVAVNESLGAVTEALTALQGANVSPAETVALIELLGTQYNGHLFVAETVALAEAVSALQGTAATRATLYGVMVEVQPWRAVLRE